MLRYDIFYLAGALLASPVLLTRTLRTGKWRTDWKARFGHTAPLDGLQAGSTVTGDATGGTRVASRVRAGVGSRPDLPTVLVHGVSVGEVAATRGLVQRLAARACVVISSTTDTGVERARSLYGGRHPVVRYPFDLSWMVRRFLDAVRPDAVALAELEVWPNFVSECTRRGIPVCVVNGRLSTSSYRGYQRARRWVGPVFRQLAAVGAQNEVYARRFVELGTPPARVQVTDTMKWDTSGRPRTGPRVEQLAAALGIDRSRPLIVAGSTGPGEEEELIATRPPAAQLLLVPRRPERFDAVAALRPEIRRRSRCDAPPDPDRPPAPRPAPNPPADLFLLDTMGELELAYALADVAIVGRSFVPMGGSDPIPPVAAGCPTLIGPHHENFAEVVSALQAGGGVIVTASPMEEAARMLEDADARRTMAECGQRVIEQHRGASRRSAHLVMGLIAGVGA